MNNNNKDSCSNNNTTTTNATGSGRNLCLYFLDQERLCSIVALSAMDEAEEEEAPTELNMVNSSVGFLVISTNKLSIKYTNMNLHGHNVGVVQANRPTPVK
ncbi:hypothetical protein CDL15_Pgr026817 [Punica granatum]|uniref:Uncharacterized protein n=1 Tax=Punica granatum TaxID=22663 RepID=A0A218WM95_PUNGR|nr:hypothetical protein CDL15_Pgr026817 [Punica granatum]PKI39678.1 hypothetical protein CRG98_039931 [Punica granatum]